MSLIFSVFRLMRRFAVLLVFVAMLALNIATLTVPAVSAMASAALGSIGIATVAASEAAERASKRVAARKTARRVAGIVRRGAIRNVGTVAAESLPYVGVVAVVGFTAAEVADACAMMEELETLDRELAPADEAPADLEAGRARVCGLTVPGPDELKAAAKTAPEAAWEKARLAAAEFDGPSLPDLSGHWARYRAGVGGWWTDLKGWVGDLRD